MEPTESPRAGQEDQRTPKRVKLNRKRRLDTSKSKNQQRNRRRNSLFKKAYEYALECDADVYVILRIRKNGQIFTFNSNTSGLWPPTEKELDTYYPIPKRLNPQDFSVEHHMEGNSENLGEQLATDSGDENCASSEMGIPRDI